ncbi:MAG TPA: DUF4012 domain-containing protein, partial [Aeromicrobium sp.]|nr:DUF4012 domain-containing protein [Aeromicrobium sp.]
QIALVLVALIVIMSTVQAWRAVRALDEAESLAQGLSDRIAQGDVAGARARLDAFDRATTTARKSTDGPIWWLGSKFPYVGRNIGALRTIAAASDSVSDRVLPGVVDVADQVQLETFRPRNKRVDLEAVARALPVLAEADQTLAEADARVMAIDVPRLMPLLQLRAGEAQAKFHQTAVAVAAAHDTARLLPTMLAERGPTRRYLMLVMNNAEVRSLAGMPGSMAVITARRGKVDMGQQGGILDVDPLVDEALDVKRELAAGFASTIASDIRDTTSVPDFPRAAQAAAAIVEERWDEDFDGVVAIDPVALSYVLAGLGSVDVGDGIQLNQNNAVRTLLNVVYVRYPLDPVRQDDVFELAARRSFDALVDGRGNSVRTIRGLLRGVQERRIMLWSRSEREQSLISSNGLAGALTHDRRTPEVAAFLNDAGSSKMQYYLRTSSRLQTRKCYANGVQALRLTTTLRSDAPQGVALPLSITGPGRYVGQGDMRLHLLVMGPQGGRVTALRVDGKRAPVGRNAYRGRAIARVSRVLPPGQSTVITADVQTAPGATSAAVLRTTPGVQANDDVVETRSCAS